MRKISILLVLTTVIFGIVTSFCIEGLDVFVQTRYYSSQLQLQRFFSYEELKSFVEAKPSISPYYKVLLDPSGVTGGSSTFGDRGSSMEAVVIPEHSTTNVQVEGVDEADIVKTDGKFIYIISGNNLTILKAHGGLVIHGEQRTEVLSQIRLNGTLRGTFINQEKLVLFEENTSRTCIRIYDVTDRMIPVSTRNVSFDGHYFSSRMIGDYVYVVINKPVHLSSGVVSLPKIYSSRGVRETPASEIYYTDASDYSYTFTTIVALNIQNDEEPSHKTILVGTTREIFVSVNNIYIAFREVERTLIHRIYIDANEISCAASGEVPGYVLNQFSMDEYEGYFRIATTTGNIMINSGNHVYILNMDLGVVGKLEDLASGEAIHSARFMGDRCYLVTFKKIDPLFVIDLTYPSSPMILGELKITGYSDYLHPYDKNHVIGIGKETVAADGDFAWYQGVKISLFDVSDVGRPMEVAKYEIGDRGTDSPILRDHKALLFDRSKNLLVIPVLVAEIDEDKYPGEIPPYTHGEYVWQGAYVFDISLNEGIVPKGQITHLESEGDFINSGYSSPYFVKRSLYIGNILYTISDKKIEVNSLENLNQINEIELP